MPKRKNIEFYIDNNGCYICTSHKPRKKKYGYPGMTRNGESIRINRYIYEQCFGEIPSGLIIRHKCDNSMCINPEHLETGTPMDNARDRVERNRGAKGSKVGTSKLVECDVTKIKQMLSLGVNAKEIAKMFHVHFGTIYRIKSGERWSSIV